MDRSCPGTALVGHPNALPRLLVVWKSLVGEASRSSSMRCVGEPRAPHHQKLTISARRKRLSQSEGAALPAYCADSGR